MDCQNCNSHFTGQYCHSCGQRAIANNRLQFKEVFQDFFDNVFNLHKGLFFTFWQLLINPGKVGRAYISGQRKKYTNPVRYLIIAIALQAFLDYWIIHPELTEQPQFFSFPFLSDQVNQSMAFWNHKLATQYSLLHNLSMILLFPIAFLYLFNNLGYNFAELLSVNFYYFGTGLVLIISFITGIYFLTGNDTPIPFIIMLNFTYIIWSSMSFFRRAPFWTRLFKVLASIFLFMFIRVFLLIYLISYFFPHS